MRKSKAIFILILLFSFSQNQAQDWRNYYENTNFEKYKSANEQLQPIYGNEKRVVFMGNSITEAWPVLRPSFFENSNYIGRGISGQTTPQMLLRFRNDVIDLEPSVVVILAGINDIAGNTGYTPINLIAENIMSMAELAMKHNIEVIICSVLPALDFPWSSGLKPAEKVIELNTILKKYAGDNNLSYVDYHTAMKDENDGLKVPEYTSEDDLVHPNIAGYKVMEELVRPAIKKALATASLSVNNLFTDHMVLQQNEKVAIWGNANPGENISVTGTWGSEAFRVTNERGEWKVNLATTKAGGPHTLSISTKNKTIHINDVLLGEVWLASGQSNMQMPLRGWPPNDPIQDSENEISAAQYADIRMFTVERNYSTREETSFKGKWEVCMPDAAKDFSASAYFFARRLHKELNVPIGIIHSSWGGTPAESWTSRSKIKELGDFDKTMAAIDDPNREKMINDWYGKLKKVPLPNKASDWIDIDLNDLALANPAYKERNWHTINLPGRIDVFNDQELDGAFWFRKNVTLDDISTDYTLLIGPIDDSDAVFLNGKKVGETINKYSEPRKYKIPRSLLKKGKNIIAIRVIDTGGPGSISNEIKMTNVNGEVISLEGEWKYNVTSEFFSGEIYTYDIENLDISERPQILYPSPYSTPSTLFNAMIHPLLPYTIKGAIWYQGESNVGRAEQYGRLFPAMIQDWRKHWNSTFPFYFVQIAPFRYNQSGDVSQDRSQKLRDAQRQSLSLNKTGMVVTLDIGNNTNIHPGNKQDVGSRLAGLALRNDYWKDVVASGPLYSDSSIEGNMIYIEFDHVGSGLMAKGSNLIGFEIAGEDKNYVVGEAQIEGDKIKVYSSAVLSPKYVRYAWRDQSEASLFNKDGLPASSFTSEH